MVNIDTDPQLKINYTTKIEQTHDKAPLTGYGLEQWEQYAANGAFNSRNKFAQQFFDIAIVLKNNDIEVSPSNIRKLVENGAFEGKNLSDIDKKALKGIRKLGHNRGEAFFEAVEKQYNCFSQLESSGRKL